MKINLFILLICLSSAVWAEADYYGTKSTEAILKFEGQIQIETSSDITFKELNSNSQTAKEIKEAIEYQLTFLIGYFQSASFIKAYKYPGVLSDTHSISYRNISKSNGDKTQTITYLYKGKVNFHSKVFSTSDTVNVPLSIPLNPYTIYQRGVVNNFNYCTDEHYNSEGDFFYFWDIGIKGCPIRKKDGSLLFVDGSLKKLKNTQSTYPEFDKLYRQNELKITTIIGYIDDVTPRHVKTSDSGYQTFKSITDDLITNGFRVVEEKKRFKISHNRELAGNSYFTKFNKEIKNQLGYNQTITLNLLLTDSETSAHDDTFETYYKEAIETSQIVSYDGHSGLGGNLELERFNSVRLPSFYQIFFLNGCSSYPYFNSMYFNAKPGGKKSLEIITTGLPTLTNTSHPNMMSFLKPFLNGRVSSYQTIMNNIEASNGSEGTYLMGVNGDEDNRFHP